MTGSPLSWFDCQRPLWSEVAVEGSAALCTLEHQVSIEDVGNLRVHLVALEDGEKLCVLRRSARAEIGNDHDWRLREEDRVPRVRDRPRRRVKDREQVLEDVKRPLDIAERGHAVDCAAVAIREARDVDERILSGDLDRVAERDRLNREIASGRDRDAPARGEAGKLNRSAEVVEDVFGGTDQ